MADQDYISKFQNPSDTDGRQADNDNQPSFYDDREISLFINLTNGFTSVESYARLTRALFSADGTTAALFFGEQIFYMEGNNLRGLMLDISNHQLKELTPFNPDLHEPPISGEPEIIFIVAMRDLGDFAAILDEVARDDETD